MSGASDIDIDPSSPTAGPDPSAAVDAAAASTAAAASEAIRGDAAIAEALAAGRIDAVTAQELLLAEVVAGLPVHSSPEAITRLTSQLRELLADDPTLARLLARA